MTHSIILAVKCVCQSTLNLTRGRLVIRNYSETGNILSVEEVNQMEPVIFSCFSKKKIIIGAKYENEENLIPFSDKGKGDFIAEFSYREFYILLRFGLWKRHYVKMPNSQDRNKVVLRVTF